MKDLGQMILLTILVVLLYWSSSILGEKVFEPYLVATVFSVAATVIFGGAFRGEIVAPVIWSIMISITLYVAADYMMQNQMEFYYSQDWDGYPKLPDLPSVTWGWITQFLITCVLAAGTYRIEADLKKEMAEEK